MHVVDPGPLWMGGYAESVITPSGVVVTNRRLPDLASLIDRALPAASEQIRDAAVRSSGLA
jgi:hypothetical protein